ncbi:MAG: glycoside hydrolase [Bacteroidetes bacterium]|nr:MAG: glycoside hydrolase [Bacteroidota bacterium]
MSIKKKFLKSKPVCKVTFKLDKKVVPQAEKVYLVGDFNNWDKQAVPMKSLKSGGFTTTLDLESGREYQFRYLVNGESWIDEPEADKYAETPFEDVKNSVVVV